MSPITRRNLVKAGVAALAAGKLLATGETSEASEEKRAQKPVRFAFIGVGARGTRHLKNLLDLPGIRVVAICDLIQKKVDRTSEIVRRQTGNLPESYCGDEYYHRRMPERDDFRRGADRHARPVARRDVDRRDECRQARGQRDSGLPHRQVG